MSKKENLLSTGIYFWNNTLLHTHHTYNICKQKREDVVQQSLKIRNNERDTAETAST